MGVQKRQVTRRTASADQSKLVEAGYVIPKGYVLAQEKPKEHEEDRKHRHHKELLIVRSCIGVLGAIVSCCVIVVLEPWASERQKELAFAGFAAASSAVVSSIGGFFYGKKQD